MSFRGLLEDNRGQALVEMALVVVPLVLLVAGIVEVGFAFGRANMITNAARDGARFAATLGNSALPGARDNDTKCFLGTGTDAVRTHVQSILDSIGFEAE